VLDRRLLFVTGKGGVGKTTVAAAIAQLAASSGRRTLVCEMDAKGSLASAYDAAPLAFEPTEVMPGLHAMAMNTEDSLREYLRLFVRIPLVTRIGPLARTFDFVADAAPGVKEILAVGKLCYEVREDHYDLVVVDAEASGHIVGQITAPRAISELVHVGLIRDQTRWMLDILEDHRRTGVVVVALPEEMPVNETLDLVARLHERTAVDIASIVVNRVLPELFGHREEAVFDALCADAPMQMLSDAMGPAGATVMDAARLSVARRRVGVEHLDRLRAALPADLAMLYVPEMFTRASGRRLVQQVVDALTDELDTGELDTDGASR
jgi:anion-transporting  ArsA/GET3 family ATPase